MAQPLVLTLSEDQRITLNDLRDHHPKPYLRERAAALLKVASGLSGRFVAHHGLLKPRQEDTVYGWVHHYEAHGLAGLYIASGRGRKPAFSPSALDS